jgi:hypothetical protein
MDELDLSLRPRLTATAQALQGCTPWLARALWLFSYERCVTVNAQLAHIIVSTRRFWWLRQTRVIGFDQVSHIVFRALPLPTLGLWRYLSDAGPTSAFFLISLALKDASEVALFTVWQSQPRPHDWLDHLAGSDTDDSGIGDEAACEIVALLRRYIGVPIGSH